ncbi:hypothetical protein THRCLA_20488 [Thraustotheca clavata]|uniref:Uncharacterized protein n=1 Tax=Thraustotheca clavata TaxID=74557 RepID=A0A1W0A6M2_9STRA|nr:hypothetical protein THRCLA_20488 [Thraustotheca clavata]
MMLLNGDIYITFEDYVIKYLGILGLIAVATYLHHTECSSIPAVFGCIYFFSSNGPRFGPCLLLCWGHFCFFAMLCLSFISAIPVTSSRWCIAFSAPIFLHTAVLSISLHAVRQTLLALLITSFILVNQHYQ